MQDLGAGLVERIKNIRLLILDVDGVLTDGKITYTDDGHDIKSFHVRDGHGIRLLLNAGIDAAIITARQSRTVDLRAKDLGISLVFQGNRDKLKAFNEILEKKSLKPHETAFIGDDLVDLPVMKRVGFSAATIDAAKEVRESVHYITRLPGGMGAAREVIELILKAQAKWDGIINSYAR